MKRSTTTAASLLLVLALAAPALAQSGHFVTGGKQAPNCTDNGTTLTCTGKVAGLGGTVFEIETVATGTMTVECTNPGGNVAPGQTSTGTLTGSTGSIPTPKKGSYNFAVSTAEPTAPSGACPNDKWTANVTDVTFTSATLNLYEDGQLTDSYRVF